MSHLSIKINPKVPPRQGSIRSQFLPSLCCAQDGPIKQLVTTGKKVQLFVNSHYFYSEMIFQLFVSNAKIWRGDYQLFQANS